MTPDEVRAYFTGDDGTYRFARWTVPVRATIFGAGPVTEALLAAALAEVGALSRHPAAVSGLAGMTWGLGIVREWRDLVDQPGLGQLLPGVARLAADAERCGWNQVRRFGHAAAGGIVRCTGLVRLGGPLGRQAPAALALRQAVLAHLAWSIPTLTRTGLMAPGPDGTERLRDDIRALLAAAYDPAVPAVSTDPGHARLIAERIAAAA